MMQSASLLPGWVTFVVPHRHVLHAPHTFPSRSADRLSTAKSHLKSTTSHYAKPHPNQLSISTRLGSKHPLSYKPSFPIISSTIVQYSSKKEFMHHKSKFYATYSAKDCTEKPEDTFHSIPTHVHSNPNSPSVSHPTEQNHLYGSSHQCQTSNADHQKNGARPTFYCSTCSYTSKMPIFICNVCQALQPEGGASPQSTLAEDSALAASSQHLTAEAAKRKHLEHTSTSSQPRSSKSNCMSSSKDTSDSSLPCGGCDPVEANANVKCSELPPTQQRCDYFEFFSCPHKFNMDAKQLKNLTNRYRELQKVLHPDVYSAKADTTPAELEDAARQSAAISDVYRTLRNPYQRALYLLKLHGIDIDRLNELQYKHMAEGSSSSASAAHNIEQLQAQEQAMLFHVMEVRETLESTNDIQTIKDILASSSSQIDECLRAMESAFERKDLFDARHRTVLLNYLSKIQQEAENKLESLES